MLTQNMANRLDLLPAAPEEIGRLLSDAVLFRRREAFSPLASLSASLRLSLPEAAVNLLACFADVLAAALAGGETAKEGGS
jgi:hypothetical protein